MRVTALNENQVIRAIKALEDGVLFYAVAQRFGVTNKTLRRAIKLYLADGASIFEPEKLPQRGIRYPDKKRQRQKEVDFKFNCLFNKFWDENITPYLKDNKAS